MTTSYPDPAMQSLLLAARRYSSDIQSQEQKENQSILAHHQEGSNHRRHSIRQGFANSRSSSRHDLGNSITKFSRPNSRNNSVSDLRRPSGVDNIKMEEQGRRLSEAGVNRRPSAAHILTEDTESFIIGDRVFVDGVKAGRIQFIGETKFGSGDWAGVFLDEPIGKNDGCVSTIRYFTCEPRHGVFSRLYRLTREPVEGAEEILNQCRRFGYEIIDAPTDRRGSLSGSSNRGSLERGSVSPRRGSTPDSRSPRHTPEPYQRGSSDFKTGNGHNVRRGSRYEKENSLGVPSRKFSQGKSPLVSPNRSDVRIIKIELDPEIEKLATEARRLSMGGTSITEKDSVFGRKLSENNLYANRNNGNYSKSNNKNDIIKNGKTSPLPHPNHSCNTNKPPSITRKQSDYLDRGRRGSFSDPTHSSLAKRDDSVTRRGSRAGVERSNSRSGYDSLTRRGSGVGLERRDSSARRKSQDIDPAELQRRRLSEAGLRRPSATDIVLNNNTDNLMVGQEVWVDGTKKGRIAYIGTVHFTKGDMAGIHLDEAVGKNNGTVGGTLYFQTEPKHGLFSRLHRLALMPLPWSE